jgi:predicted RNA methylase
MNNFDGINDYANSMFHFEQLHDKWINECVKYLDILFNVKDKIVVDYAFGRGNWSLAFAKLGAKKVISIDASLDNVNKFQNYINKNKIENIEILHGNIMINSIDLEADIVWVYGIIPCIEQLDVFLQKLKFLSSSNAEFLFYTYSKTSLRKHIVTKVREYIQYTNFSSFSKDICKFTNKSRIRARDDLVVDIINWHTKKEFAELLENNGYEISAETIDFYEFQNNKKNSEFTPFQFKAKKGTAKFNMKDEVFPYIEEVNILNIFIDELVHNLTNGDIKKDIIISIHNILYSKEQCEDIIIEIFIYLIAIFKYYNVVSFNETIKNYITLVEKSQAGYPLEISYENCIQKYLVKNNVRY